MAFVVGRVLRMQLFYWWYFENTRLSTATRTPPRKRKIPKTRYQQTNDACRPGVRLFSRWGPQISARLGEVKLQQTLLAPSQRRSPRG